MVPLPCNVTIGGVVSTQEEDPVLLVSPIGHVSHVNDPAFAANVPGAHWRHDQPVVAFALHGAQRTQLATLPVLTLPSFHGAQTGAVIVTVLVTCVAVFPCVSV